jgi:L-ascorbate peroxidase
VTTATAARATQAVVRGMQRILISAKDNGAAQPMPQSVADPSTALEAEVRAALVGLMPVEHAPAHLRFAFHDAGTYDVNTNTGGAHGTIRLREELFRADNTGWGQECMALFREVKASFPSIGWADLIMLGGAAAVEKCSGPIIEIGLGRVDGDEPAPPHRLPGGYEGAAMLKRMFARMGLTVQDLAVLSGAHTLGHTQRKPFTTDPWVFSNSYYVDLLSQTGPGLLQTDSAMLDDAELRPYVELYARDEARFRADFAESYRRLSWLGNPTV